MAGIELRSPSFGDHQPIPARHAKDHDNLSPALAWSGVPQQAVELAVLCQDPDAPRGTFTHWVLAGLEPTATGLAEGERPAVAVEGRNDFDEEGYSGPLPPVGDGPHRYFFWVFLSRPRARIGHNAPTRCRVVWAGGKAFRTLRCRSGTRCPRAPAIRPDVRTGFGEGSAPGYGIRTKNCDCPAAHSPNKHT
jgi:Raf kinase inhibitor-like YbhB/YbcL family protein